MPSVAASGGYSCINIAMDVLWTHVMHRRQQKPVPKVKAQAPPPDFEITGCCRVLSSGLIAVIVAIAAGLLIRPAASAGPAPDDLERCRVITEDAARLRCFKSIMGQRWTANPAALGEWRLVRTHGPQGEPDTVSIMHTADMGRSDLDLAGLMLRCRDNGAEVLIILVRSLSPRARPDVTITVAGQATRFSATVVPPLTAVLLPPEAAEMAKGSWQTAAEISIEITDAQGPIKGVIPLTGLKAAYDALMANCPRQ